MRPQSFHLCKAAQYYSTSGLVNSIILYKLRYCSFASKVNYLQRRELQSYPFRFLLLGYNIACIELCQIFGRDCLKFLVVRHFFISLLTHLCLSPYKLFLSITSIKMKVSFVVIIVCIVLLFKFI